MGESLSTTIDNYDSSIEKEKELAEIIKGATLEEWEIAKDVISNADAAKLAGLIETNFKSDGVWKRYGDMKKDSFYNFYVEATIDLLSDKLLDNDGNEKKFSFNWKDWTLDDHLKDLNWIDNNYSRDLVKLAQKAMWIKESQQDGLAWPQFFAKACSILSWNWISDFRVNWFEWNNRYKYDLDDDIANYNQQLEKQNSDRESLISKLNLKNYSDWTLSYDYFWIPAGVNLYKMDDSTNDEWIYYFDWNVLKWVHDLRTNKEYWRFWVSKEYKNNEREFNYALSNKKYIETYLNNVFHSNLQSNWLDIEGKDIKFDEDEDKYYLSSFWKKFFISSNIQNEHCFYSQEFNNGWWDVFCELKLMNLCNYLWWELYKNWRTWVFSYSDWRLQHQWMNIMDRSKFITIYWNLSSGDWNRLTKFLNNRIPLKTA